MMRITFARLGAVALFDQQINQAVDKQLQSKSLRKAFPPKASK